MDLEKFNGKAGKLEKITEGSYTFIPCKIPTHINYDNKLLLLLSKATHKIGELSGAGEHLPNPNLLIVPYINREAIMSSRIEGTRITISELYKSQIQHEEGKDEDAVEVKNYISALNYALDSKEERITLDLIKKMHSILMSNNIRGHNKMPGKFRDMQNWIGFTDKIEDANYVPPPPAKVPDLMKELEDYINEDNVPSLIQAALMHYQFETIHPFCDGNGRIGRSLITLLLCKKKVILHPLLYLSAYFEKNRTEYESLLLRVNQEGCFEELIKFFLLGVQSQSEDAIDRAKKLYGIREAYRKKIQGVTMSNQAMNLIDSLFNNPFITISKAADVLDTTYPTAKRIIVDSFLKTGVLVEADKKERNKLYCAESILRTLEL